MLFYRVSGCVVLFAVVSHVVHEGAAWIEVVPGEGADLPLVPEVGERNLQGAGEEHLWVQRSTG